MVKIHTIVFRDYESDVFSDKLEDIVNEIEAAGNTFTVQCHISGQNILAVVFERQKKK